MHVTAGLILSLVFQLAYVIEGPEYYARARGTERNDGRRMACARNENHDELRP